MAFGFIVAKKSHLIVLNIQACRRHFLL